jgi:8-oxo-dGTP pyrophosphatase MutT (NUDIX family)
MENPWETKNSKIVYETKWMKIREDEVVRPDSSDGKYSYVDTPDSVYIVPITTDGKVYLIAQWRYPTKTFSWELPGGGGDGGDILESAKRELKEETGLEAEEWTEVGTLQPMNGVVAEIEHVFIARKLRETQDHKQTDDGITEIKKVRFDEIFEMIVQGDITDAQTIAAFTQVQLYLKKKKG